MILEVNACVFKALSSIVQLSLPKGLEKGKDISLHTQYMQGG